MSAPLALTLGDPAGVGPEIAGKAWSALRTTGPAFALIGGARALPAGAPARVIQSMAEAADVFAGALPVLPLPEEDAALAGGVRPGLADPAHAPLILASIARAVALAASGEAAGLVTLPIAKAPLYAAGFRHPGHTEHLGALTADLPVTGPRGPVMMLAADGLRVVPVTVHVPLSAVATALTTPAIVAAGRVAAHALAHDFGRAAPRLAVAALNPHAGENGALGREEADVIAPAVAQLQAEGVDVAGPFPADTLFHAEARARYDAVLCMYHDQALIPLKMMDFWGGVNVTLGLPVVRTSPDHGTGFSIAGKGVARPDSLIAALRMAAAIAARRVR